MSKSKTKIFLSIILLTLIFPMAATAAGLVPCATDETGQTACTLCHFIIGFKNLIDYGLVIIIVLSITAIFCAGTLYVVSSGDETMMTKAKSFLKATLYGFTFVFLSWLIIDVTMYALSAKKATDEGGVLGINITGWNTFTCDAVSTQGQGGVPMGVCGAVDKTTINSAPKLTELCSSGTASAVTGNGPWNWTCGGSACVAWKTGALQKGACGTAINNSYYNAPTEGLCSVGAVMATPVLNTSKDKWIWECNGVNGGEKASCEAAKSATSTLQNGECGTANGKTLAAAPTGADLCKKGTASNDPAPLSGSDYVWKCNGIDGGTPANCRAIKMGSRPGPGDDGRGNADLVISFDSFSNCCSTNVPATYTITVKNQGSGPAGPFKVKGYISEDDKIDFPLKGPLWGDQSTYVWSVSGLAAGATASNSNITATFGNYAIHHWYNLIQVVDADNEIGETNENNNTSTRQTYVGR